MQPGDRLICAFVRPRHAGYEFKHWPLHITIVPWFRLDLPVEELAQDYKRHLIGSKRFEIRVGETAQFGYKKRKQVNLVSAPELTRLEGQTRRFLHVHGAWVVDEADKTRRKFRPHITVQDAERVNPDDSFQCNRLYIVEQHGNYKAIEGEVTF